MRPCVKCKAETQGLRICCECSEPQPVLCHACGMESVPGEKGRCTCGRVMWEALARPMSEKHKAVLTPDVLALMRKVRKLHPDTLISGGGA